MLVDSYRRHSGGAGRSAFCSRRGDRGGNRLVKLSLRILRRPIYIPRTGKKVEQLRNNNERSKPRYFFMPVWVESSLKSQTLNFIQCPLAPGNHIHQSPLHRFYSWVAHNTKKTQILNVRYSRQYFNVEPIKGYNKGRAFLQIFLVLLFILKLSLPNGVSQAESSLFGKSCSAIDLCVMKWYLGSIGNYQQC